jgi:hypothetical protein
MNHIKILDVFYGNKCNLACSNCDTRSDVIRNTSYDPELEDIKQGILLANKKFDVENWGILGGEPLLYKEKVLEIIKFIRTIDSEKTIFLSTNGLLLDKNIDWIVNLIKNYRVWVQVCNHTSLFSDKDKITNAVHKIGNASGIKETVPAYTWWYEIMKLESGIDIWKQYVKDKGLDVTNRDPNDITYMMRNFGIHYIESTKFHSIYQLVDGTPKPYKSDPEEAYKNSCPSQFCAFLYNKKIYKCAALGTLRNFLDNRNLLKDKDWEEYLNYKAVDLINSPESDFVNFSKTHYSHINECSMCPSKCQNIIKTKENVLPIKFH